MTHLRDFVEREVARPLRDRDRGDRGGACSAWPMRRAAITVEEAVAEPLARSLVAKGVNYRLGVRRNCSVPNATRAAADRCAMTSAERGHTADPPVSSIERLGTCRGRSFRLSVPSNSRPLPVGYAGPSLWSRVHPRIVPMLPVTRRLTTWTRSKPSSPSCCRSSMTRPRPPRTPLAFTAGAWSGQCPPRRAPWWRLAPGASAGWPPRPGRSSTPACRSPMEASGPA